MVGVVAEDVVAVDTAYDLVLELVGEIQPCGYWHAVKGPRKNNFSNPEG